MCAGGRKYYVNSRNVYNLASNDPSIFLTNPMERQPGSIFGPLQGGRKININQDIDQWIMVDYRSKSEQLASCGNRMLTMSYYYFLFVFIRFKEITFPSIIYYY